MDQSPDSRAPRAANLTEKQSYFDQAADMLGRAFKATNLGEQAVLLDEALRLHQLALAEERARLAESRKPANSKGG